MNKDNCEFCLEKVYLNQGIIQTDESRVLYPLKPVILGHFIIIPKRHINLFTELTREELEDIKNTISLLNKVLLSNYEIIGFNLLNNNGQDADQHIPHTHIHIFFRRRNEVSPFDILAKKVEKENINQEDWNKRLFQFKQWISLFSQTK